MLSNQEIRLKENLDTCHHEEADTLHAAMDGYKDIMIKANDTDIVVIAVSARQHLQDIGLQKMWVAFGQGANLRWIPIHDIMSAIGPEKSAGLLFFHAFSGCDTVSAF